MKDDIALAKSQCDVAKARAKEFLRQAKQTDSDAERRDLTEQATATEKAAPTVPVPP